VKYFATSATDQLEASGGSPVNVVDNFGRVITASLFDGGDLIYTKNTALQGNNNNNFTAIIQFSNQHVLAGTSS